MTRIGGHVHEMRRNVVVSRVLLVANLALLGATGALFARLMDAGLVGTLKAAGVFLAGGALAIVISLARLPRVTGAYPATGYLPEVRGLLDGVSLAAGILPPALYLIQDPYPNAFAFGVHPNRARVAVTTGLLDIMTPREVEAVLAHEVAHIANRDTQVMTIAYGTFAFLNFISMFWAFIAAAAATGAITTGDDDEGVAIVAGVIGLFAFFMLLLTLPVTAGSWLLTMAISRDREALADATAVRYLSSPTQLRHAFEKMAAYPVRPYTRQIAAMCVHGAGKHRSAGSTHPPMGWRINTLRRLEGLPPDEAAVAYLEAAP
ncbi:MAG: M48 family metallopeptidase, partial [Actinomycetota bacterium]